MANKELTAETLGLSFTVPERPTVRQHLAYRSAIAAMTSNDMFLRHWEGAKQLIVNWSADHLPDYQIGLDDVTDPKAADTIIAACNLVAGYMVSLDNDDPN